MLTLNCQELLEFDIKEFPTHIAKTANKYKENQFIKINGQLIYNSNLSRFQRNIVVKNMHNFIMPLLAKDINILESDLTVRLEYNLPINYATVSRRYKKDLFKWIISWKEPAEDYEPTNDIDNIDLIWRKVIIDCLKQDIIIEDNMKYVRRVISEVNFVDTLDERFIKITIYKNN